MLLVFRQPCCNLLQINCTTGTLQHHPDVYNFSMFAPFIESGLSVSVSLEGTGGMAACCSSADDCPMLQSKDLLAQQLLELALKYKLTSFTGDWEFSTVEAKPPVLTLKDLHTLQCLNLLQIWVYS
jgi:hypothetical protein